MKIKNSARLSYKLMDDQDIDCLFELDQNPEVMRFINGGKPSTYDDIVNIMLPRMNSYRNPQKGWGLWKVETVDEKEFIGWILVRPMDFFNEKKDDKDIELGWRFLQSSWGKGYATEAAKAVMNELINLGIYDKMSALVLKGNTASINIMKKLGMKYIKSDLHKDPLGDLEADYYSIDC